MLALPCATRAPDRPTIASVSPAFVSAADGGEVTISGTALTKTTEVMVGDQRASSFEVLSPYAVRVKIPQGTGSVHLRAVTPAGTSTTSRSDEVTYTAALDAPPPPPTPPTLTYTDPDSPANDNSPKIKGTAPAGSTIRLYTDASCSSAVAATGSAADFASPGLAVAVADDSSTTFHATATGQAGNTSDCSSSSITYVEDSMLSVSPPPLGGSGPPGMGPGAGSLTGPGAVPAPRDLVAPTVNASVNNTRFRVGRGRTPTIAANKRRKAPIGTTFRITLSEPASLTIRIDWQARGVRAGKKCIRTSKGRKAKDRKCTLMIPAGVLVRRNGKQGRNDVKFSGRLANKALTPGTYRAQVVATDPAGNRSEPRSLAFGVVK